MNFSAHPRVIGLASALELPGIDPLEEIRAYCRRQVERFAQGTRGVRTILDLQQMICVHLNLAVHYVWTDADVDELKRRYLAAGEIIFATLPGQLSPDAFGVLFRLGKHGRRARYATVIDCRGDKQHRRYWTLWHEIAHCLTDVSQMALPLRRTTTSGLTRDPIEQLTDVIAGDLAFYSPLFRPVFDQEFQRAGRVTFRMVDSVREKFCSDASHAATLNACVSAAPASTVLMEVAPRHKKEEAKRVAAGESGIRAALRVTRIFSNDAARAAGWYLFKNMRVPPSSVISRVHEQDAHTILAGGVVEENLADWTASGRRHLAAKVIVEARGLGGHVSALITAA